MLRVVVPAEVHFPLECPAAHIAGERLEARVLAAVGDEVRRLAERFAADLAFVGLFTGVNVGVLLHVGLLVEALAAVLARVGPRVRVDEQVRGERRGALERLAALLALEDAARARSQGPVARRARCSHGHDPRSCRLCAKTPPLDGHVVGRQQDSAPYGR